MTDNVSDPFAGLPSNPDHNGATIETLPGVDLSGGVVFQQPIDIGSLMGTDFPPIKWVVPELIPEGLTLLAGPPKIGKSWLTFDLALAVATGGMCLDRDVRQGDVLLLALEDNGRRIKDRMQQLYPNFDERNWDDLGKALQVYDTARWNEFHRINNGAMDVLDAWRENAAKPRLVIVDVLQKIRPAAGSRQSEYEAVYQSMSILHKWASRHRISVIVIHHTKKGGSPTSDPFEAVSGSMGLTASADTTVILSHDPESHHDGLLYGRGRDAPEFMEPLSFTGCVWLPVTGADALRMSEERREVIRVISDNGGEAVGVQTIADALGKPRNTVEKLIGKMAKCGEVRRAARGSYSLPREGS